MVDRFRRSRAPGPRARLQTRQQEACRQPLTDCCCICFFPLGSASVSSERFASLSEKKKAKVEVSLLLNPYILADTGGPALAGMALTGATNASTIAVCFLCGEAVQRSFTVEERSCYLSDPVTLRNVMEQIGWIR